MRLNWIAAAIAAAMSTTVPALAGGEWPDGPNKLWFESLQRPDNHLAPYRNLDPKSLFCCGIADTVKTKFKVEPGDERYPEDRWYAWLKDEWVRVPPKRSSPTSRWTDKPICLCWRHTIQCAGCADSEVQKSIGGQAERPADRGTGKMTYLERSVGIGPPCKMKEVLWIDPISLSQDSSPMQLRHERPYARR